MTLARLLRWPSPAAGPAPEPVDAAATAPPPPANGGDMAYYYNGKPITPGMIDIGGLVTQLEQDVSLTLQLIQDTSQEARAKVEESIALVGQIQDASRGLVRLSASARETSDRLVETARELADSNIEIDRKVTASDHLLGEARALAGAVSGQMDDLADVAKTIAAVVDVIRTIARQTNLLALNATIEAARAGPAGRGFSVVATEVKALASQVQQATADVAGKIASLEHAVAGSSSTMTQMADLIARFDPVLASIRSAAAVQIDATHEVTSRAIATADFADVVAQNAEAMNELAVSANTVTNLAGQAAGNTSTTLERLSGRSIIYFRRSLNPEEIDPTRVPVEIATTVRTGDRCQSATTVELNQAGIMLARKDLDLALNEPVTLEMQGIGALTARVQAVSELGIYLRYTDPDTAVRTLLAETARRARAACQPEIELTQQAAAEIGRAFGHALDHDGLTEETLFSTRYTQIPGIQPVQYTVPALSYYERILPPFIERYRTLADHPWFVLAIDRNAYVPVHHPEYSLPPRPNDVVWTDLNCRNRRIMSRAQTLEAARNILPILTTTYRREMKDGSAVFGKLVAAPIFVRDRHWGNAIICTRIGNALAFRPPQQQSTSDVVL